MTPVSVRSSRVSVVGTLVGLVLLAVNLRAAITGVSPLLDELQHSFGLSSAAMGVLTTLPVLCLGVFAAAAPPLARRLGAETTLVGALMLIAGGILVRLLPAAIALFAGTALAGAGIAMANVLMPYVIKRAFPDRVGSMTGLAMMLMSGGAALAAGLAVPLDGMGGWRLPLAVWVVPALLAVAAWIPLARRTPTDATPHTAPAENGGESLLRSPLAWAITGFMGMQSLAFYVLMSWLPAVMKAQGFAAGTAGLMLSVMMTLGIPAGLVMPILAARMRDQRSLVIAVMALMGVGTAGLLLAPGAGWLWVVVLGIATGSAFPLAFTLITLRSAGPRIAARLSGMAQTAGYLLAGAGPLAFGVLHSVTGGWNVPLTVLLVWLVPETVVALRAARPAQIGTAAAPTIVDVPLVEPRQFAQR
jgi:CP family cyanate transporter-like MFS transporter